MNKYLYIVATVIVDFLTLLLTWYVFYYIKFRLGWFEFETPIEPAEHLLPSVVLALFWHIIFAVFGLYRNLFMISRLDEILRVGKISIIGTLILFFILFIDQLNWNAGNIGLAKYYAIFYWAAVFFTVSLGRYAVRTIQKILTLKGIGLHKALIVGVGENAKTVFADLQRNRIWGLEVVGFVSVKRQREETLDGLERPLLGSLKRLRTIIEEHSIQDVIVALEKPESRKLVEIVDRIDLPNVSVKILPDFYQMIVGLNRTNQIFGLPLIDVLPDPMPFWEKIVKRLFDLIMSFLLLILTFPIILFLTVIIPLTSKGNPIFSQVRVGLFGKPFTIYKFRTMYIDAEARTGPVWATENDPRITPLGLWLRKLRLDELPQLWNVCKGDMSLVGPRPERPHFVEQFKQQIPLYSRRLRVRPGITGWAQVKWKYDSTLDDVKEKTKYDLFYVENMSLKMDFKILINTISTVLTGKGQ